MTLRFEGIELSRVEKELEEKYGSLKRDVGQDEEGMFFVIEGDDGEPIKKSYIENEDYQKLLALNLI